MLGGEIRIRNFDTVLKRHKKPFSFIRERLFMLENMEAPQELIEEIPSKTD